MSFMTEEPDNVKTVLAEMRQQWEAGAFKKPWRLNMNIGYSYWPTHPSASNHPVDDYKWSDLYDHPKD